MANPQSIIGYLQDNFGQVGRLSANGQEFVMPSILVPNDYKKHFSINVDTGLWQDFKTGERGNFAKFLTIAENITYAKAKEKVFLMEFLGEQPRSYLPKRLEPKEHDLGSLIPVNISSYDSSNALVKKAWVMLFERKLFNTEEWEEDPFYVCTEGVFKDRLIIPYKNDNGRMFYFQARSMVGGRNPKYLNPGSGAESNRKILHRDAHPDTAVPLSLGMSPSHILYPYEEDADYLVICEGVLDVISLRLQGINSTCTCGSSVSRTQADLLAGFEGKIILGYDNDKAGSRGIEKFEKLRKLLLMPEFHVCSPPPGTKDWNEAYMKDHDLSKWFAENTQRYDYDYVMNRSLNSL